MPTRLTLGVFLCLVTGLFLLSETRKGTFAQIEEGWVSWLLANSPQLGGKPAVTFIQIDDPQDRIFDSWPLSPGDYALVLNNLQQFAPPTVGIAAPLRWEEPGLLYTSLISQLQTLPNVVLGIGLGYQEAEASFVDPTIANLFQAIPQVIGDTSKIPPITSILDLPQDEVRSGRPIAFTHIEPDPIAPAPEGAPPKIPLLARYGEEVYPNFALRLGIAHLGVDTQDLKISLGRWVRLGKKQIPIDATGAMSLDLDLRPSVPRMNASALLLGSNPDSIALNDQEVRAISTLDKNIVVLGTDDPGSRHFAHPGLPGPISSADFLATAIATIQAGDHAQALPVPGQILLAALCLLASGALFTLTPKHALRTGLLAILAFGVISLLAFQTLKLWTSPILPLGILLIAILTSCLTRHAAAESP